MLSQRNLDKIRHLPVHPHLQANASAFTSFESVYKMSYKNWRWKRAWHHAGKAQQGFTQLVNKTPIPPPPSLSSFNSVPKAGCWAHPRGGCCPLSPFPPLSPPACGAGGGSGPRPVGREMLLSPPLFGSFPADTPVLGKGDLLLPQRLLQPQRKTLYCKMSAEPFPWDYRAPRHWNMVLAPRELRFLSRCLRPFVTA